MEENHFPEIRHTGLLEEQSSFDLKLYPVYALGGSLTEDSHFNEYPNDRRHDRQGHDK